MAQLSHRFKQRAASLLVKPEDLPVLNKQAGNHEVIEYIESLCAD